jgi:hypothetical protein
MILSRDTPLCPDVSSHQISTKNRQSFRNYRAEGKYYAIWDQGHRVKVKSRIDTNHSRNPTFVYPDTSSHQIPRSQGQRPHPVDTILSRDAPLSTDTPNINQKSCRLGIIERKGNIRTADIARKNIKYPNLRWRGCLFFSQVSSGRFFQSCTYPKIYTYCSLCL